MLQLNPEPVIQNASLMVSWCLEERDLERLKETGGVIKEKGGIGMPYMLLVVVSEDRFYQEQRYLAPLDKGFQYVNFRRPGKHLLIGAVVFTEKHGDLERRYIRGKTEEYERSLIYFDAHRQPIGLKTLRHSKMATGALELEVPQEVFAPEPPRLERAWVMLFDKSSPRDQCDYRRKRAYAYTLQPFQALAVLCFMMPVRLLIAAGMLVAGFWKVEYRPLYLPFGLNWNTGDIWSCGDITRSGNFWYILLRRQVPKVLPTGVRRALVVSNTTRRQVWEQQLPQRYASLICSGEQQTYQPRLLRHRIYLHYQRAKLKVCKPFAAR